ncbi:MBL fold metallo-hydrolase [Leifsonia flava]|uniref:MBL fold metallo-hydrolase n=1 Tax=Orlajensenia leifsoniae TaxID=2561933 RepID=A0A4Y9R611_9MICO|nr:MBL fold metallo-hydrolase [Leifsonia flava]TFV99113.1 MBL fold metallo-hydrolase [Leifsonia flava]
MLRLVAEGVLVHESECVQSNAVAVEGDAGVLLVDPGITRAELVVLADDLRDRGRPVIAGFATHPHWDHVLWHPALGNAPRYGTTACAASVRELLATPGWEGDVAEGLPPEFADDIPMELLGLITGLPANAPLIPWDGPGVRIIEHRAHSEGHAALLIEERGVLVAGDMLSDVLVPMLDLAAESPIEDYLDALQSFDRVAAGVDVVVPGHGSVGGAGRLRERIEQDRAYLLALRDGRTPSDPRIGPAAKPGWEWVSDVHDWQLRALARRSEQ